MEEMLELLDHHNCRINDSPFCTGDAHLGDAVGAPDLKDDVLAFPGSYSIRPMRNKELKY